MPDLFDIFIQAEMQIADLERAFDGCDRIARRRGDAVIVEGRDGSESVIAIGPIAALVMALRSLPEAKP